MILWMFFDGCGWFQWEFEKVSMCRCFGYCVCQCCLLRTFANSLDTDQARQNVGLDLDPITVWHSEEFFEKYIYILDNEQTTKNSWPASSTCWLPFANSLDPNQPRQNIRPDLDFNSLRIWWSSWMSLENNNFGESQQTTTKTLKITQHAKS